MEKCTMCNFTLINRVTDQGVTIDEVCMVNYAHFIESVEFPEEYYCHDSVPLWEQLCMLENANPTRAIWSVIVIQTLQWYDDSSTDEDADIILKTKTRYFDLTESWMKKDFLGDCKPQFNVGDFRPCGEILAEHINMLDSIEPLPF